MTSMVHAGHAVHLYSYNGALRVPPGVTLRSAAEIASPDQLLFHQKSGSPALLADIFRYSALRASAGIWVDTDIFLLRDLNDMGEHIFGWEDHRTINNAVLKLPAASKCLADLCELAASPVLVAPFWSVRKRTVQRLRGLVDAQVPLSALEWGVIGPKALTHFVKANELVNHAQPSDVFYPVHWREAAEFWDAHTQVERKFTSSTRAVHLWNKGLKRSAIVPAPANSFLARKARELNLNLFQA